MMVALESWDFTDDERRAIRIQLGRSGLATRVECRRAAFAAILGAMEDTVHNFTDDDR